MATAPDIFKKLKTLSPDEKPNINIDELYMASKLVSRGIKKKDFGDLSIQDVYNDDMSVKDQIEKLSFNVPDDLVDDLDSYAGYLHQREKYSPLQPDSPLLPFYEGGAGQRKMSRHLRPLKGNFNNIRKQGVIDYHQQLSRRLSSSQARKETADQFQITERQVEAILNDKIQKPGRPSANSPEGEVIASLDKFAVWDLTNTEDYDNACQERDEVLATAATTKSPYLKGLCVAVVEEMDKLIKARKGRETKDCTDASIVRYERFKDLFDLLPTEKHDDKLDFD